MDRNIIAQNKTGVNLIFSLLIYIVIFVTLSIMLVAVFALFIPKHEQSDNYIFVLQLIMLLTVLITTFSVQRWIDRVPFSYLGLFTRSRLRDIWYGFLAAVSIFAVGFGASCMIGLIQVENYSVNWMALISSFVFFLIVSFSEEIMCRGYFLGRMLDARVNKFFALFASSLIFAILHIFNPNLTLLSLVNLVLAGCMLGATYIYVRNLWFPISLHHFWNWIQGGILGYDVSGTKTFSGILELSYPSYNIWNGGLFGFEGSLVCTILTVLYTVAIIAYFERKEAKK